MSDSVVIRKADIDKWIAGELGTAEFINVLRADPPAVSTVSVECPADLREEVNGDGTFQWIVYDMGLMPEQIQTKEQVCALRSAWIMFNAMLQKPPTPNPDLGSVVEALEGCKKDLDAHREMVSKLFSLKEPTRDSMVDIVFEYANANCGPFDRSLKTLISTLRSTVTQAPKAITPVQPSAVVSREAIYKIVSNAKITWNETIDAIYALQLPQPVAPVQGGGVVELRKAFDAGRKSMGDTKHPDKEFALYLTATQSAPEVKP